MAERRAIDVALDLARMPSFSTVVRRRPVPADILDVIRVAAGCPEASQAATEAVREPLSIIKAAAIFYLQEALFFPGADLYRNLGVAPGASRAQMRLHMRWLLQWLHPDHNSDETARLLAARVIHAWQELGRRDRSESRIDCEAAQRRFPVGTGTKTRSPAKRSSALSRVRIRWIAVPLPSARSTPSRGQRAIIVVLALAAALALILVRGAMGSGLPSLQRIEWAIASGRPLGNIGALMTISWQGDHARADH